MDWNPARIWPKAFGLALALVSAAGLLSFDLNDPTFTNLRAHSQGIANWMGLPGALVGGSLVEIFGSASLLVPLLILNWLVTSHHRPPIYAYLCWSVFLMAAVASIHGLFRPPLLPGVGDAGLAGWSAGYWMAITTGPWAGGALLVFIGLYAGNRLLFHPVLRIGRQALGDASFFLLSLCRDGWLQIRQNLHSAAAPPRPGGTLWSLPGMLADALFFWRGSSLRRIKARRALEEPAFSGEPFPAPVGMPEIPPRDEFDSWLAEMGAIGGSGAEQAGTRENREESPRENDPPPVSRGERAFDGAAGERKAARSDGEPPHGFPAPQRANPPGMTGEHGEEWGGRGGGQSGYFRGHDAGHGGAVFPTLRRRGRGKGRNGFRRRRCHTGKREWNRG
ncbi:MAG: DNA translocase FtsK 4TM domain-containing protein [SAR324 cluster bacterium]|nr:DNA translocase FtsK 4TM domain-containing protein [SAR324 cluster bacterium]